ncbi:MAG: IclR family transcriptional regulator [Deltaproteobacteria bacterium]|nr:IclR family transcriptional regulator [Deltaproteobacteria bacterium]
MGQKTIQSLEKGLDLLFLFTEEKSSLSIDEISSRSGLPRSTCYRFLNTFKQKRLMEVDGPSGKYRLSVRLLKLQSAIHRSLSIAQISLPYLQKLSAISGETAQLVLLDRNEGVCVERVDSTATLRVMPDKGNTIHLHSGASGKVIMAHLSPEERERVIREKGLKKVTANTITDPAVLNRDLEEIRKRGYAQSDQEIYPGVKAVAAPIFDFQGKVIASVGVAGPRERLPRKKVTLLIPHIKEAARNISIRLGANLQ